MYVELEDIIRNYFKTRNIFDIIMIKLLGDDCTGEHEDYFEVFKQTADFVCDRKTFTLENIKNVWNRNYIKCGLNLDYFKYIVYDILCNYILIEIYNTNKNNEDIELIMFYLCMQYTNGNSLFNDITIEVLNDFYSKINYKDLNNEETISKFSFAEMIKNQVINTGLIKGSIFYDINNLIATQYLEDLEKENNKSQDSNENTKQESKVINLNSRKKTSNIKQSYF